MIDQNVLLEIKNARPSFDETYLPPVRFNLKLHTGECVIIESQNLEACAAFADLCSGMVRLAEGEILFGGLDWSKLREPRLSALRGRIGRIFQQGEWIDMYSIAVNVLLPIMHHTHRNLDDIISEALYLCHAFDLPGLPVDFPRQMSPVDLARAGCVRALLGKPQLLLLEFPCEEHNVEIAPTLMEMLNFAQNRGACIVCFTRQRSIWTGYKQRVTQWMRLQEQGLTPMGSL